MLDVDVRARSAPCGECPWRRDVAPGRFTPDRFRALANTTHDAAVPVFTCHKSSERNPVVCAGFLLIGATHNLSVRFWYALGRLNPWAVTDGGHPLYPSYVDMAVANGVPADDPALKECRS